MNKKGKLLTSAQILYHMQIFHSIPQDPFLLPFFNKILLFHDQNTCHCILIPFKMFSGSLSSESS